MRNNLIITIFQEFNLNHISHQTLSIEKETYKEIIKKILILNYYPKLFKNNKSVIEFFIESLLDL